MKPDEADFLRAVAAMSPEDSVRDVVNRHPVHHKRAWYLLQKWTDKRWYDCGVSLDLGWLTEEGKRVAVELPARG